MKKRQKDGCGRLENEAERRKLFRVGETCDIHRQKGKDEREIGCQRNRSLMKKDPEVEENIQQRCLPCLGEIRIRFFFL